jgi:hypothetical protein
LGIFCPLFLYFTLSFFNFFGTFSPCKSQGAWLVKDESPFCLFRLFVLLKVEKAAKRCFVNLLMEHSLSLLSLRFLVATMHRCWDVTELTQITFQELEPVPYEPGTDRRITENGQLYWLALTCCKFWDPALDRLWENTYDFIYLLKMSPFPHLGDLRRVIRALFIFCMTSI